MYRTLPVCFIVVLSMMSVGLAEDSKSKSITQKCGRDAVFQAVRSFGSDLSLEQIDEAFDNRQEVSVDQIVDVLKHLGYQAHAQWLDPHGERSVGYKVWNPARYAYIVALPPKTAERWHYALVDRLTDDELTFVQPRNGELRRLPFSALASGDRLGLIRIEPHRSHAAFNLMAVLDWFGSPMTLVTLAALIALAWAWLSRKKQHIANNPAAADGSLGITPGKLAAGSVGLCGVAFLVFHAFGPRRGSSVAAETVLRFNEPEIQAGSLLSATVHEIPVTVRNVSASSVEIAEVKTSCSCVGVSPATFTLRPRQSERLIVEVRPPGEGDSTQTVQLVDAKAEVLAETKITYQGRLPARLTPTKWHLGTIRSGASDQVFDKTVTVTDYVGQPLRGVRVKSMGETPLIDVQLIGDPVFREDAELKLRLRPTGHWFRGLFTQKVRVTFENVPEEDLTLELQVSAEMLGPQA